MTPLAHRITKELTLPLKRRTFDDRAGLLPRMSDVHCFEVSEVRALAEQLAGQFPVYGVDARSTFLPAPKTWLEWLKPNRERVGLLISEQGDGTAGILIAELCHDGSWGSYSREFGINLNYSPTDRRFEGLRRARVDLAKMEYSEEFVLALLAIINTPRIIGRRQHMPHRGLERRLVAARAAVGKFPLHAWTEIKLEVVGVPKDATGEPWAEAQARYLPHHRASWRWHCLGKRLHSIPPGEELLAPTKSHDFRGWSGRHAWRVGRCYNRCGAVDCSESNRTF